MKTLFILVCFGVIATGMSRIIHPDIQYDHWVGYALECFVFAGSLKFFMMWSDEQDRIQQCQREWAINESR